MKTTLSLIALFVLYLSPITIASNIHHGRGIFDPLVSAVDSLFGISAATSTSAPAAATTPAQTPVSTSARPTTTEVSQPASTTPASAQQAPHQSTSTAASSSSSSTHGAKTKSTASATTVTSVTSTTTITSSASTTTVTSSASTTTTSSTHPSSTSASSTSPSPLQGIPSGSPSSSQTTADAGNHVSTAGIAVAAIFGVVIIAGIAYLVLKFNPTVNGKYEQWRESRRKQRTYRAGFSGADDEEVGLGVGVRYKISSPTDFRVVDIKGDSSPVDDQGAFEDTPISPITPLPQDKKARPFSFQRLSRSLSPLVPSPSLPSARMTIPRKPVASPSPTNYMPYRPGPQHPIGVAVPMGRQMKQLPAVPR